MFEVNVYSNVDLLSLTTCTPDIFRMIKPKRKE